MSTNTQPAAADVRRSVRQGGAVPSPADYRVPLASPEARRKVRDALHAARVHEPDAQCVLAILSRPDLSERRAFDLRMALLAYGEAQDRLASASVRLRGVIGGER